MKQLIVLNVNDVTYEIAVESSAVLIDVLREQLGIFRSETRL